MKGETEREIWGEWCVWERERDKENKYLYTYICTRWGYRITKPMNELSKIKTRKRGGHTNREESIFLSLMKAYLKKRKFKYFVKIVEKSEWYDRDNVERDSERKSEKERGAREREREYIKLVECWAGNGNPRTNIELTISNFVKDETLTKYYSSSSSFFSSSNSPSSSPLCSSLSSAAIRRLLDTDRGRERKLEVWKLRPIRQANFRHCV